jgi:error-prone DNA polymerase
MLSLIRVTDKTKPLVSKFIRDITDIKYINRINTELEIIESKDFVNCYLQVWEIINIIRSKPTLWVLRGSAACSLVAYCMGIHDIDPLKENIPLERFLNFTRCDQPDFDIDVPYNERDEILEEVKRLYPGMVSRLSNRVVYQPKSALREAVRRCGYRKQLPKYFKVENIFDDEDKVEECYQIADELLGQQRMWSKHCGGLVIWKNGIPKDLILKDDQIMLDKYDVDEQNLIKIDLLCSRGLAQLKELSTQKVSSYPFDDKLTSELFCRGDVIGLTQSESRTMYKTIMAIQPKNMYDVALALALIRPAAADGGRKARYFANGKKDGIVFDEDALEYISTALQCSLGEADKFRRGFSKGNDKIIDEFKSRCGDKDVIKELKHLQKYSFSKGHSIAYGQMVWALGYHKVRNPNSFWKSTLKHNHSGYRKWVHLREGITNGVEIVNPVRGSNIDQFIKTGWWDSYEFLPDMGVDKEGEKTYFKGIVANYRRLNRGKNSVILCSLGIDNGKYVDVILKQKMPGYYNIIEGVGVEKQNYGSSYIEVEQFVPSNFKQSKEETWEKFFK